MLAHLCPHLPHHDRRILSNQKFSTDFFGFEDFVRRRVIELSPWTILNVLFQVKSLTLLVQALRGTPVERVVIVMFGSVPGIEISNLRISTALDEASLALVNPRQVYAYGYHANGTNNSFYGLGACPKYMSEWSPEVISLCCVEFGADDFLKTLLSGAGRVEVTDCAVVPVPLFSSILHLFVDATMLEIDIRELKLSSEDIRDLAAARKAVNLQKTVAEKYSIRISNLDAQIKPKILASLFPIRCLEGTTLRIEFDNVISSNSTRKKLTRAFNRKFNNIILSFGPSFFTVSKPLSK